MINRKKLGDIIRLAMACLTAIGFSLMFGMIAAGTGLYIVAVVASASLLLTAAAAVSNRGLKHRVGAALLTAAFLMVSVLLLSGGYFATEELALAGAETAVAALLVTFLFPPLSFGG